MKIDSTPVMRQQSASAIQGGPAEMRLKTGDIVECEVLAKENGVLRLKTGDGSVIKAKLEDGVVLKEGDTVKLLVTGKKNGVVHLSTDLEQLAAGRPGDAGAVRAAPDTALSRVITRLGQLNIPVREELLGRISELIAANPDMTIDEAVFLASNKIPAESPMMDSMLSLLSDGAKLDKMITSLLSLLQNPGTDTAATEQNAAAAQQSGAGIADWVSSALDKAGPADTSAFAAVTMPGAANLAEPTALAATGQETEATAGVPAKAGAPEAENSGAGMVKASSDTVIPQSNTELHAKITENVEKTPIKLIMSLLSEIPEFKGTPPEALERFSGALVRAAADGAQGAAGAPDDVSRLTEMIDKMFARPEREGGGERLRQVKDELLVRLSMLEEEISRAGTPGKEAAAQQAQKVIDHVRAMQNVEQYVYMQIPVKLGEENKAAELYVFRQRKGTKQFDPENVNVLLSVDLTHLGHWESLVNIRGRDVSLRMEVQSAEAKEFFGGNTVKLHSLLDEAGFRLTEASISYSEEETNPLTALASLLRFKTGNNPRIDLAV